MTKTVLARPGRGRATLPANPGYLPYKRAADVVLASILLVLTAPVVLLAALLVKLTSSGPAFYSQMRLGRHGRPFRLYKIRTMVHDCESRTGPRWATRDDPRVILVGRLLRRTHLDELPQLWNVLKGEMSLVGPRPERPEFVRRLERAVPRYRDRLSILPGITGLAQVHLPSDTSIRSVRRKMAYDLHYVQRLGPWLDLQILIGTALHLTAILLPVFSGLLVSPGRGLVEQGGEGKAAETSMTPTSQSERCGSLWNESVAALGVQRRSDLSWTGS